MMPSLAILPTWRVVISRATLRVCIFRLLGWVLPIAPQPHIWVVDPILSISGCPQWTGNAAEAFRITSSSISPSVSLCTYPVGTYWGHNTQCWGCRKQNFQKKRKKTLNAGARTPRLHVPRETGKMYTYFSSVHSSKILLISTLFGSG